MDIGELKSKMTQPSLHERAELYIYLGRTSDERAVNARRLAELNVSPMGGWYQREFLEATDEFRLAFIHNGKVHLRNFSDYMDGASIMTINEVFVALSSTEEDADIDVDLSGLID